MFIGDRHECVAFRYDVLGVQDGAEFFDQLRVSSCDSEVINVCTKEDLLSSGSVDLVKETVVQWRSLVAIFQQESCNGLVEQLGRASKSIKCSL